MDKTNLRCLLLHKKGIFPLFLSLVLVGGCGVGGESAEPVATAPSPVLLTSHSMFERKVQASGVAGIEPQPARLSIWSHTEQGWAEERLEDPESNVFHKALPFEDGILTLSGEKAMVKHWTRKSGVWRATQIWSKNWGGKFNRMRDAEFADLDGDGANEMILATHDQGVLAVGSRAKSGEWSFEELGQKPDTFVHEIEVGDVDGDGQIEFYGTPSARVKEICRPKPAVWSMFLSGWEVRCKRRGHLVGYPCERDICHERQTITPLCCEGGECNGMQIVLLEPKDGSL